MAQFIPIQNNFSAGMLPDSPDEASLQLVDGLLPTGRGLRSIFSLRPNVSSAIQNTQSFTQFDGNNYIQTGNELLVNGSSIDLQVGFQPLRYRRYRNHILANNRNGIWIVNSEGGLDGDVNDKWRRVLTPTGWTPELVESINGYICVAFGQEFYWNNPLNIDYWLDFPLTNRDDSIADIEGRIGINDGIVRAIRKVGAFVVVFTDEAVISFDLVDNVIVFRTQTIFDGGGAHSQNAVVSTGELLIFYNENGIWATDGTQVRNLSARRIQRYIQERFANESPLGFYVKNEQVVIFFFQSQAIVYSIADDNWSTSSLSVSGIDSANYSGVIISGIPVSIGRPSTTRGNFFEPPDFNIRDTGMTLQIPFGSVGFDIGAFESWVLSS